MDESLPKVVLTVVISMLVLTVGVFIFYTVYGSIGYSVDQTETFNVTDPSIANTHTLKYYPESISSVYQFNGVEWVLVDPSYYSCNQQLFTIQPGGMDG